MDRLDFGGDFLEVDAGKHGIRVETNDSLVFLGKTDAERVVDEFGRYIDSTRREVYVVDLVETTLPHVTVVYRNPGAAGSYLAESGLTGKVVVRNG